MALERSLQLLADLRAAPSDPWLALEAHDMADALAVPGASAALLMLAHSLRGAADGTHPGPGDAGPASDDGSEAGSQPASEPPHRPATPTAASPAPVAAQSSPAVPKGATARAAGAEQAEAARGDVGKAGAGGSAAEGDAAESAALVEDIRALVAEVRHRAGHMRDAVSASSRATEHHTEAMEGSVAAVRTADAAVRATDAAKGSSALGRLVGRIPGAGMVLGPVLDLLAQVLWYAAVGGVTAVCVFLMLAAPSARVVYVRGP